MKTMMMLMTLTLSFAAFADQCQLNDLDVTERAKLLIKNNSEVIQFCKPCGEKVKDAKVQTVRNLKEVKSGSRSELFLNYDKRLSIDLAYTYVKVAPNMYVNAALVVGCLASDVPKTISK